MLGLAYVGGMLVHFCRNWHRPTSEVILPQTLF